MGKYCEFHPSHARRANHTPRSILVVSLQCAHLHVLGECAALSYNIKPMPKRTYQPKTRKRAKEHGFMKRMANRAGRKLLNRRRNKGRAKLTA